MGAQTRRPRSEPSASMSKAVKRGPKVSPTIKVRPSGVITVPLGNESSSATTRAAPSGVTRISAAGCCSSFWCRSKPKLPT